MRKGKAHGTTDHAAVLVTGSTGTTGSRVASRLVALGHRVSAATRRPTAPDSARSVRFDWHEPSTYAHALHGADRVYLVPPVGDPHPAAVMLPFLHEAREAGVRRAVLLGSSAIPAGGPGVGRVQEALPGLFEEWAVLRPSWFMQNFTGDHVHADGIRTEGVIRTATGTGRVGFVDADDIAAVAVHALTDDRPPNTDLLLTGPEALSHDDIADILTGTTGRPVAHRPLSPGQLRDRLTAAGMPAEFAGMLAELDRAIAAGAEDRVLDTVERVTGRPARSFRRHVEETMRQARTP